MYFKSIIVNQLMGGNLLARPPNFQTTLSSNHKPVYKNTSDQKNRNQTKKSKHNKTKKGATITLSCMPGRTARSSVI